MKAVARRLQRLEERLAPKQDERELRIAAVLRGRRCRRLAQERGVPYEQVLREELIEKQTFWAKYVGDGTCADTLRYAQRRRFEAWKAAQETAQSCRIAPVGATDESSEACVEPRKD